MNNSGPSTRPRRPSRRSPRGVVVTRPYHLSVADRTAIPLAAGCSAEGAEKRDRRRTRANRTPSADGLKPSARRRCARIKRTRIMLPYPVLRRYRVIRRGVYRDLNPSAVMSLRTWDIKRNFSFSDDLSA